MSFPATTPTQGYVMTHGIAPNGGGSYVNQYTLIMDIMFPAASSGQWRSLFQTNPGNSNDGDLFVNPGNGIGISGVYDGNLSADDLASRGFRRGPDAPDGALRKFIDGALVGTQDLDGLDGRWSLDSTALLFADEDNETRMGFVNSIQIRPEAMLPADIAALGGATAAGIPLPAAPVLAPSRQPERRRELSSRHDRRPSPGRWPTPAAWCKLICYAAGSCFKASLKCRLSQSNYLWAINPSLGDTNNYRIRLTSVGYPAVTDSSDSNFSVFGSIGTVNPLFGQPLQTNGGFESLFTNWQTIAGTPLVLTSAGGKGSPHGGTNFLHGGINTTASNAIVRQDIDLIAAGFTTNDLDTGAVLDAEAWLRNFYGAGTFDDQVFYRVGYLDGAGQELSAVRCIIAANSVWLQRNLSGLLPAGTRKLRLEVVGKHRRDADNDSMADDLIVRLQKPFPLPTPNITKLPMLQDVRTDAMTLIWETDGNLARHYVDWGRSNITEHTLSRSRRCRLTPRISCIAPRSPGLAPETSYVYRVRSGTTPRPAYPFQTAPKRYSPFVTAWWGDNHDGTDTFCATHVTNLWRTRRT